MFCEGSDAIFGENGVREAGVPAIYFELFKQCFSF